MKSASKEIAATCGFKCLFFIRRLPADLRLCLQRWAPFTLKPPFLLPCITQWFFC